MSQGKKYRIGRHALTKEQMDKLMLSFDKISDKALIGLAIATGMRRNDVVQVRRVDIDFDKGIIKFTVKQCLVNVTKN
jgi:integrase